MKSHKWEENICIVCNLKRRTRALSKDLRIPFPGTYFYDYFVDGEWIQKRPDCFSREINIIETNLDKNTERMVNLIKCLEEERNNILGIDEKSIKNDKQDNFRGTNGSRYGRLISR